MHNNTLFFYLLFFSSLLAGFISGWTLKDCSTGSGNAIYKSAGVIKLHDTILTPLVRYKIIPGRKYNVDSILESINTSWKDSLKNLYGKGMFETKFTKENKLGIREITFDSRIPVDPEAVITIDEQLKLPEVYPKRTFGIFAGLNYEAKNNLMGSFGLKYYLLDFHNFSLECKYLIMFKTWSSIASIEAELRL